MPRIRNMKFKAPTGDHYTLTHTTSPELGGKVGGAHAHCQNGDISLLSDPDFDPDGSFVPPAVPNSEYPKCVVLGCTVTVDHAHEQLQGLDREYWVAKKDRLSGGYGPIVSPATPSEGVE